MGESSTSWSRPRRVFVDSPVDEAAGAALQFSEDDSRYVGRTLRLRGGDTIEIADGTGRLWEGTLHFEGGRAEARKLTNTHTEAPPVPRVLLASLIKTNRWEWLVEKAAELGVTTLVPIRAERSDVRERDIKRERWLRIARQAARQCGRLHAMCIDNATTLEAGLSALGAHTLLYADEKHRNTPTPALAPAQAVAVAIGPEGGWDASERRLLDERGTAMGLGSTILRAETAAICALSVIRARQERIA